MKDATSKARHQRVVMTAIAVGAMTLVAACSGSSSADTTGSSAPSEAAASNSAPASSGAESAGAESDKQYRIAYLAQGTTNSWAAQMDEIMRTVSDDSGKVSELLYFDAAGNGDTQLGQLESAINLKPDAMILTPLSKAGDVGPVERAMAQGIPVVLCASSIDSENFTTHVAPNTYEASLTAARWLVNDRLGGQGTVAVVDGIAGVDTSEIMGKAIRDAVSEAPGVKIVSEGYGQFSVTDSKKLAQSFLDSGEQIDAWWGSGGESTTGIMSALVDAKPASMPPVAGATLSNGVLRMAVDNGIPVGALQFPATMAKNCFDAAITALEGGELPKFIDITALPGNENVNSPEADALFDPKYTDDYVIGSDTILSQEQLAQLNLVK